jgi:C-terminal processing protease CtpA/Prc
MVAKRPFYMTELVPKNPTAILKLKRPDGSLYTAELIWEKDFSPLGKTNFVSPKGDYLMISAGYKKFNKAAAGSGFEMGGWRPFFVPENSENSSKLMEVEANKKHLERYKVKLENKGKTNQFPFFAALYKYRGKTILLVRQATYSPELSDSTMIGAYQALLDQYEEFADVLVIDQTFNPGGSVDYAEKFFRLFVKPRQEAKSAVQAMNVDRRWVRTFNEWAQAFLAKDQELSNRFLLRAKQIDDALNSGLSITSPMTLFSKATITGDPVFTWKKPVLVLANELSGSCGDFFPFLMKENGIAKIFGERTMGLGGNVEEVVTLPNSQARISLTRGLATLYSETGIYKDSDYIENKGVEPNFPHKLTFDDFLSGFPDYLDAVSKKAIEQIGNSMNCSPNQCLDNDPQEFAADEGLAAPAKPANSPATGK